MEPTKPNYLTDEEKAELRLQYEAVKAFPQPVNATYLMQVLREVPRLLAELTSLQAELAEAERALEFYANIDNHASVWRFFGDRNSATVVIDEDSTIARAALAKIRGTNES